jgi:hypothetical protein
LVCPLRRSRPNSRVTSPKGLAGFELVFEELGEALAFLEALESILVE